jgi:hypothetical protein
MIGAEAPITGSALLPRDPLAEEAEERAALATATARGSLDRGKLLQGRRPEVLCPIRIERSIEHSDRTVLGASGGSGPRNGSDRGGQGGQRPLGRFLAPPGAEALRQARYVERPARAAGTRRRTSRRTRRSTEGAGRDWSTKRLVQFVTRRLASKVRSAFEIGPRGHNMWTVLTGQEWFLPGRIAPEAR